MNADNWGNESVDFSPNSEEESTEEGMDVSGDYYVGQPTPKKNGLIFHVIH